MRFRLVGVAIVASGLLVSACSSGTSSPGVASLKSPGSSGVGSQGATGDYTAFDKCMRKHGVDPNALPAPSAGVVKLSPSFGVAMNACQSLQPPAPADPTGNQDFAKALLKQAACMRAHGIPYPDPSFGNSGHTAEIKMPANVNPNSPSFQAANKKCQPTGLGGGMKQFSVPANGASAR